MNNQLWLYVSVAALAGLILGAGLVWLIMRGSKKERQQYEAVKTNFENYRQQVDKHFVDTASAVDELNRSYQKVLQQLSTDAKQLMEKDVMQEQLNKRGNKSVTLAFLTQEDIENSQPELVSSPPYTDITEAEVVPINGLPDQVPDRIGPKAGQLDEQLAHHRHTANNA